MVDMILDMLNIQEKSSLPVCRLDPLSLTLLNIGREVVGCSGILLLKNPFAYALTPEDAKCVMIRLRLLAEKHCYCIVMTVSQAISGIFGYFTEITVLGFNGATLFHGPASFSKQVFSFHGQECPEDYNFLDFLLLHVCPLRDAAADAMVIYSADSDFSKASRRAAADIRCQRVQFPTLIERRQTNELQKRTEQGDLKWFASMLKLEWKLVANDPNILSRFLLFPLVLGTVVGCVFFGLPRDSVGAQERAGYFFLLLLLFAIDAVFDRSALRQRILWSDVVTHRVNVLAYLLSCLFGELILKRGAPIVVMVTGSYIFMGLAEDLLLYLEFLALALLGSWATLVTLLAFDLALFSCAHPRPEEHAPPRRAPPGAVSLASAASACGAGVLGLGVLTMGCPVTARDVPVALCWVGYCLPLQSVFGAMLANQVGRGLPDGQGLLGKMGALPPGHLLLALAVPLVYLALALHLFLLRFPEPESGPATRLQGSLLDSCLRALHRALAACARLAAPRDAPAPAQHGKPQPPPQRRGVGGAVDAA